MRGLLRPTVYRVIFCHGQAKEKKVQSARCSVLRLASSERRGNQEEAADTTGWQNINDRRNCVVIPVICRSLLSRASCDRDRSSFPPPLTPFPLKRKGGLIFLEFHERSNWNSVWENSPSVISVREKNIISYLGIFTSIQTVSSIEVEESRVRSSLGGKQFYSSSFAFVCSFIRKWHKNHWNSPFIFFFPSLILAIREIQSSCCWNFSDAWRMWITV